MSRNRNMRNVIDADTGQPVIDRREQRSYEQAIDSLSYPVKLRPNVKRLLAVEMYKLTKQHEKERADISNRPTPDPSVPFKKLPKAVAKACRTFWRARKAEEQSREAIEQAGFQLPYTETKILIRKSTEAERQAYHAEGERLRKEQYQKYQEASQDFARLVREFADAEEQRIREQIKKESADLLTKLDRVGKHKALPPAPADQLTVAEIVDAVAVED